MLQDPCAPHYDVSTGLYHVSYQSNLDLNDSDWGSIAWRSASSRDLVSWTPTHSLPLMPDTDYDHKGVFTGCRIPNKDSSLIYAYTSVSDLPIHHTLPHVRGSESLSLAKSIDGGRTWQKFAGNPILPSEPSGLDVTGWRDPYVSEWPSMATALGLDSKNTLFGIISGGIRDVTPTTFLYSIDANDPTRWQYIGPLVNFGVNLRPSRWSGDLGKNWEVTNFLTLQDAANPGLTRDFLVMGTEGCLSSSMSSQISEEAQGPSRPLRGQLWMSGTLQRHYLGTSTLSVDVQMEYDFGGHLDHGCLYAANSFFDPKTSKHIVWGWITEEDLCDELRHEQGWSGLLSLPREIKIQTIENVVCARKSKLESITSVEIEGNPSGTHTVRTLATEPVTSVVQLLRSKASARRARLSQPLPTRDSYNLAFTSDDMQTSAWELDCAFHVSKSCQEIGLQIVHSRGKSIISLDLEALNINYSIDFTQSTTLSFSPTDETFTINRPSFASPSRANLINTTPEKAPHTLFTTVDTFDQRVEEPLRIRVWRDNSVLEVFVNERTAISTRIYAAEQTVGLRFFANDVPAFGRSQLIHGTLWDGIGA
jgi:beta-fructofuranosidase